MCVGCVYVNVSLRLQKRELVKTKTVFRVKYVCVCVCMLTCLWDYKKERRIHLKRGKNVQDYSFFAKFSALSRIDFFRSIESEILLRDDPGWWDEWKPWLNEGFIITFCQRTAKQILIRSPFLKYLSKYCE